MAGRKTALLLAFLVALCLLLDGGNGAREAAVHGFGAPKLGRAAGSMGKTEEWQLRQVPSGPDPLHHNGSPRKPQTP